jgi:hypothetical protein
VFDFHAIVTEEIEQHPSADPDDVADAVLRRIPANELRSVLNLVMRSFIRIRVGQRRARRAVVAPEKVSGVGRSWKVQGAADAWRRHLTDRYNIGSHKWKMLNEMGYDDLVFSAEYREQQAAANQAQAERLRSWAQLLVQHQAPTFGDLPEEVQREAIEGTREDAVAS